MLRLFVLIEKAREVSLKLARFKHIIFNLFATICGSRFYRYITLPSIALPLE